MRGIDFKALGKIRRLSDPRYGSPHSRMIERRSLDNRNADDLVIAAINQPPHNHFLKLDAPHPHDLSRPLGGGQGLIDDGRAAIEAQQRKLRVGWRR
jgi:hypothetical protein